MASMAREPMEMEYPCIQASMSPVKPDQGNTPQNMCVPAPSTSRSSETWAGQSIEEDISEGKTTRGIGYLQNECDIDNDCAEDMKLNNEMNMRMCEDDNSSMAVNENSQECEFTRKGMCKIHNIKGNRMEAKTKKWKKKKFGYGWVTTTTIRYSCSLDSVGQIRSENDSQVQHSDLSPGNNSSSNGDYQALILSNLIGQNEMEGLESDSSIKR